MPVRRIAVAILGVVDAAHTVCSACCGGGHHQLAAAGDHHHSKASCGEFDALVNAFDPSVYVLAVIGPPDAKELVTSDTYWCLLNKTKSGHRNRCM